jgi:putative transposase
MALKQRHGYKLRKGRHSRTGHYYFLTASVAGRRPIFAEPNHAKVVLDAIRWLHGSGRFFVDAAVVMPDHFHMAGQLQQSTLSNVMHTLKRFSANKIVRVGVATPVWQKGYYDHALRDDEDYRIKVQYLIDNPVRAGLVKRAQDYPFLLLPGWWG